MIRTQHRDFVYPGGTGGAGGVGGVTGGVAGAGEGPTVNFGRVQNLTNNMYVGDVPVPFPKFFLNNSSVNQGQGLINFLDSVIFKLNCI